MKTTFQLTRLDYLKALYLAGNYRKIWGIFWGVFGLAVAWFVLPKYQEGTAINQAQLVAIILIPLLIMMLQYGVSFILGDRYFQKNPYLSQPVTLEVTDKGLILFTQEETIDVFWHQVIKWRANSHYILLYVMPTLFYVIPKSTDQQNFSLETFQCLLEEKIGKAS